ncbi:efflux RND transporter periplasmic adaptor subunit [Tabrizicola caldifontis]|uniref:efflux RND transporter periplasmic adaptor subunit n=1 Tax=Tabrizicola caldifontis TaxID=2528036 RepID=UPI001081A6AE|nr:efflux RND transporter periplasmic adaptor subunit [Rhodobacter sp. YIM 73028]
MRSSHFLTLALSLGLVLPAPMLLAQEAAAEPAMSSLPAITVTEVRSRTLTDRVIASGLVAAVEEVQVAPLIEGQPLEELRADVGDTVAAGQVLAVLSRTSLELQKSEAVASLAAARAGIAQVEAQLVEAQAAEAEAVRVADRTARLREQGTAPQAQLDTANANATAAKARVQVAKEALESARAQLALAEARLENVDLMLSRTEVKAPVAGRIIARNARLGAIATAAGQPMFVLIRDGALELRADVSEGDVLRLKEGQPALLRAVGVPDTLSGIVRMVEPTIDPVTRLGRVRIHIDEPDRLRVGMFVEAEIVADEHQALAVPLTAVGSSAEGPTVMRVRDGLVERVVVTTGIRDGAFVEIVNGLAAGDLVVAKAGAFVRAGDRINPVPDAGATN